jgi:hypothetical protein
VVGISARAAAMGPADIAAAKARVFKCDARDMAIAPLRPCRPYRRRLRDIPTLMHDEVIVHD